ncbi:MAG TPA: DUF1328 domain-containing protein [Urbifossiella sp.]|nr:DUF1328 domain-containing protein [Urbifossiella sp.]
MIRWAVLFLLIALVAAVFGFGELGGEAAWIGKVLVLVFLTLAVGSLFQGRRPRTRTRTRSAF